MLPVCAPQSKRPRFRRALPIGWRGGRGATGTLLPYRRRGDCSTESRGQETSPVERSTLITSGRDPVTLAYSLRGDAIRLRLFDFLVSSWDHPYRSGRADCWLKVKNPAAPAVTREAEEEWN